MHVRTRADQLTAITRAVLREVPGTSRSNEAVAALAAFYRELEPVTDGFANVESDGGLALRPFAAANCVDDHKRTAAFVRGTGEAVAAALEKFGGPVHLLYAGCGPWATLLTPLLSVFDAGQLRVHLADIHPASVHSAVDLITRLGMGAAIEEVYEGDVLHYQGKRPLDVILSETMDIGLQKEPQWSITRHLAPLLRPGGYFVPQRVVVDLAVKSGPVLCSPLLELSAQQDFTALPYFYDSGWEHLELPTVTMPEISEQLLLELRTEVQVYGDIHLRDNDSLLSLYDNFFYLQPEYSGRPVRFSYRIHPSTSICYEIL